MNIENNDPKRSSIVLIMGGMGFIGSHIVVELLGGNTYIPIIIDNLSNSKPDVLSKVELITGKKPLFFNCDLCDYDAVLKVIDSIYAIPKFTQCKIDSVIHLAGLKAVSESIKLPVEYYQNNLVSTLNVLKMMKKYDIYNLIFSSSATVYGSSFSDINGIIETDTIGMGITNPYGMSKYMIELMLKDLKTSDTENKWKIISLRYFNPVGAHPSGLIGEDPLGIPNNLMPVMLRSIKENNTLKVFGSDYDTPDGTCVRDFIHVVDLAKAHIAALNSFQTNKFQKYKVYNIGTGKGSSVLDLIKAFEQSNNVSISYQIVGRRDGDLATVFCNPSLAYKELGWQAYKNLNDICEDAYNYIIRRS